MNGTSLQRKGCINLTKVEPDNILSNVSFNGILFFYANDGSNGSELWKSDGTNAGTTLFKDINVGPSSSNINHQTVVNGTLFFEANSLFF